MGFLGRIFGSSKQSDVNDEQSAREMLDEIRNTVTTNPKQAEKLLIRAGRKGYDLFGMGKPLHLEYRQLYEEVLQRLAPNKAVKQWPTVKDLCWDTWEYPTIGGMVTTLADESSEVIHIFPPVKRQIKNAVAELNALLCLADSEETVMAVAGDEDTYLRKDFLMEASTALDTDAEEVLQDLMDYATSQGQKTECLVA